MVGLTDLALARGILLATLAVAVVAFVVVRARFDLVALCTLLFLTLVGIVDPADAFGGFAHPAVITVVSVLVLSRGLQRSGMIDLLAARLPALKDRVSLQIFLLLGLTVVCSAFMNNVGAMALLMPVAIRIARTSGISPASMLMPLAFASLLGGMTTLIGTPPNLIVAGFRSEAGLPAFGLFDFTPVGLAVAAVGVAFISFLGWRLVPVREQIGVPRRIERYFTDLRIPETSPLVGRRLRDVGGDAATDLLVVGLLRHGRPIPTPLASEILEADDVLVVQADPSDLPGLLSGHALEVAGTEIGRDMVLTEGVHAVEAVVPPRSRAEGASARSLGLRQRYGVNLLAVARQGRRRISRLARMPLEAGDVLLLQGHRDTLVPIIRALGCIPLAEREIRKGLKRRAIPALGAFGAAIILVSTGILAPQIAFAGAAVVLVLSGVLTVSEAYESVDWPIVVLLGAMLPVGLALESTGAAALLAGALVSAAGALPPEAVLVLLLAATMMLTDVVNNAAAAVLACPVALDAARLLGVSPDPFLMAVAVGASCAFLTPIGHASSTLVMGPGGYRFKDYWRLGLPLEAVVLITAGLLIPVVWPL
jgi:di/tricarboxylate transporter